MTLERRTVLQNAATATGNGTAMNLSGIASVAVQTTGTFSATITWEASIDGSNWESVYAYNTRTSQSALTATAADIYLIPVAGFRLLRARISSYTSGSITATAIGTAHATSLGTPLDGTSRNNIGGA